MRNIMRQGIGKFVGLMLFALLLVPVWGNLSAAEISRTKLKVENLSCSSCLYAINSELQQQEGMVAMDADLGQGLVVVDHVAPLDREKIATVITNLGYPATVLESVVLTEEEQKEKKLAQGPGAAGCRCSASGASWRQLYDKYLNNSDQSGKTE